MSRSEEGIQVDELRDIGNVFWIEWINVGRVKDHTYKRLKCETCQSQ